MFVSQRFSRNLGAQMGIRLQLNRRASSERRVRRSVRLAFDQPPRGELPDLEGV